MSRTENKEVIFLEPKDKIKERIIKDCKAIQEQLDCGEVWHPNTLYSDDGSIEIIVRKK